MRKDVLACQQPRHAAVKARRRCVRLVVTVGTFVGLHLLVPVAFAQQPWPAIVVRGGALVADLSSDIRIDTTIGNIGTSIDLENALGFDTNSTTYFVDGTWRISRRNQLQFDFEYINRDVSRQFLSAPITFHDTTFNVNASVDAFFDSYYLSAYYGFAFVATPHVELGASIGVTVVRLHSGIGLSAGVSGSEEVSRDLTEDARFDVPVPLPGLFVNIRPHPRITIIGSTRGLKATVNNISASLVEAKGGVDVKLAGPLGVGGGYYYNRVKAERDDSRTDGRIVYSFNGPQVYAMLAF